MRLSLTNTTTFERIAGFGDSTTLNDNMFAAVTFDSAAGCRAQLMVQTQLPDGQQTTTFHDMPFVGEFFPTERIDCVGWKAMSIDEYKNGVLV